MSYTEHHFYSHDYLLLYYRNYGSGSNVVVCLPGMSRNSKDFEDLAEHLCARYRVISPDFRGRGQSAWDPDLSNYHPLTYAMDTWTLLDSLGIERFVVLGTSLGGLTAMIMAGQQASRLQAVILNDTAPEIPTQAAARILQYIGRTPPVSDWNEAAKQTRQTYQLALPGMPDEFWHSYVRYAYREDECGRPVPEMDPAVGDALRESSNDGFDHWSSYHALTMPCLLLRGALSDLLTQEIVDRMRAIKPDLELVTVPGRGHAPLLDEELSRAAIDRFIDNKFESGP